MSARARFAAGAAALVLSACACSAEPDARTARKASASAAAISTLDVARLSGLVAQDKVLLVDVRTPEEFAQGHIAGAINVPLQEFDPATVPHAEGKQTVLYCRSGRRSELAAEQLVGAGEPAIHLGGGITAWETAGQPVTTGG